MSDPTPVGMTEDQAREFAELKASFTAAEAARQAAEEQAKQANERSLKLERDARHKRFTDEVRGKSEQSGIRWFGEPDKHVSFLEKLADSFGEESEEVAHYVTTERAHAEQLRDSNLFREYGSDAEGGASGTALAQLEAKAKQYAEEKSVTFPVAFDAVAQANPELYAAHRAERRKG